MSEVPNYQDPEAPQRRTFEVAAGTLPLWEQMRQEKIANAMGAHEEAIDANGQRLDDEAVQQRKAMAALFASRKGQSKKRR